MQLPTSMIKLGHLYNHRAREELNQGEIIDDEFSQAKIIIDKKLSQARVSDKKPMGAVKNGVDKGDLYTEHEREAIEINTLMEELLVIP